MYLNPSRIVDYNHFPQYFVPQGPPLMTQQQIFQAQFKILSDENFMRRCFMQEQERLKHEASLITNGQSEQGIITKDARILGFKGDKFSAFKIRNKG